MKGIREVLEEEYELGDEVVDDGDAHYVPWMESSSHLVCCTHHEHNPMYTSILFL